MQLRWLTIVLAGGGLLTACTQPEPTPTPTGPLEALAFTTQVDGQWDLFASDAAGKNIVQLTDTPVREMDPRWSPDGTRIAFATWDEPEAFGFGDPHGLYTINADGTGLRQLEDRNVVLSWSWSPDSTLLAYTVISDEFPDCGSGFSWDLRIVEAASGREVAVAPDSPTFTVWAPDGRGLYGLSGFSEFAVYFPLDTIEAVQPTDLKLIPVASSAASGQVIWAGSGEAMFGNFEIPGPRWMWATDSDGKNLRKLAESVASDFIELGERPFSPLEMFFFTDEWTYCGGPYVRYQRAFAPDGGKFAYVSIGGDATRGEIPTKGFGDLIHLNVVDTAAAEPSSTSISFRELIDDWDRIEAQTEGYNQQYTLVDLTWSRDSDRLFYSVADPASSCCALSSNWRFFWYQPSDGSRGELLANIEPAQKAWLACCGLIEPGSADDPSAAGSPLTPKPFALPPHVRLVTSWGTEGRGDGQLDRPNSIAVDATGTVYVVEDIGARVQLFSSDGEFLDKWFGFGSLNGVAVGGSGLVYVAQLSGVRVLSPDGEQLRTLPLPGSPEMGITADAAGNVYITHGAAFGTPKVQVSTSAGELLGTWPGDWWLAPGIAVNASGNGYVVDRDGHRVHMYDADGNWLGTFGAEGRDDGQFSSPEGIAVDAEGNVYVADTGNHRVQAFSSTGQFLSSWGTLGSQGGQFQRPAGITAADGKIYVADTGNQRVQVFSVDLLSAQGQP